MHMDPDVYIIQFVSYLYWCVTNRYAFLGDDHADYPFVEDPLEAV